MHRDLISTCLYIGIRQQVMTGVSFPNQFWMCFAVRDNMSVLTRFDCIWKRINIFNIQRNSTISQNITKYSEDGHVKYKV